MSVAPMMDWTDLYFRQLTRLLSRHTWLYTEMVVVRHRMPAALTQVAAAVATEHGRRCSSLRSRSACLRYRKTHRSVAARYFWPFTSDRMPSGRAE